MTLDEAKKIARIVSNADGGCQSCVRSLVEELNNDFPEFVFKLPPNWYELYWESRIVSVNMREAGIFFLLPSGE